MTLFKLTKDGVQKFNTVYSYDKLDRVQSITNGTNVSSYTYDRNGRLSESTTNGTTTTYGYNRAGWVTSLATQSGSSQLQSHSYQYYPDGNISEKQSTVGTLSEQVSYQYDDAGRLVREQIGNDITEFTYDNYSNRATMTNGSTTNTYTYDANNRLLKAVKTQNNTDEITNYIYDNNGNQIAWYKGSISPSGGTASLTLTDETDGTDYGYYTYDAFNRLSTYTNGVINASYTYGADNLRQSKTVDGVTTNYVWNGSDMVLEENSTGTNKYYYGADGIAFADFNGTTNYYQKNAHGDITALTDANGTITRNYQFDAFGNELTDNTNDINPFRYAGEYQDLCSGLIYLRNRYYDPSIGRFITEDPARDGLNWYVYCNNNPIKYIDPSGTVPVETIIDLASIGWSFSDFVSNPSWANFGFLAWDVAATLVPYAPGSYSAKTIKAGTQILSKSDNYVKSGVWAMKAFDRGYEIEKALGGMANNFPVIDKYVKSQYRAGIMWLSSVTSIKSIDITASSYKSGNTMKNLLKKYVDDLAAFKGKPYKDTYYQLESCGNKILEIAIPPVEMTSNQAKVFKEIKEYATEKGIELITRIVE